MSFRSFGIAAFAAATLASSGCAPYYRSQNLPWYYSASTSNDTNTPDSTDTPDPFASPTPAPGPSPTPTSASPTANTPPYTQVVRGVGVKELTYTFSAGKKLRVKFTPGIQDANVGNTAFSPKYAHLGVYITVGGQTQPTAMLSNGLQDGQPQSTILDFSAGIAGNCPGNDTSCRAQVQIKISKPNNDYWCLNYARYCPWTEVYSTHPWNGTLVIETDDTLPLDDF